MTLSPGDSWGSLATLYADAPIAHSDRELAELVQTDPDSELTIGLTAGDLCRTLGGRGDVESRLGKQTTIVPVDVAEIRLDDENPLMFVAHMVGRGRFWSGQGLVAMNAEWMGEWRMAPRAHPGDGILDVVSGHLSLRQRLLARSRLPVGEHLPHPGLESSRRRDIDVSFGRRRRIYLDGTYVGTHDRVQIAVGRSRVNIAV